MNATHRAVREAASGYVLDLVLRVLLLLLVLGQVVFLASRYRVRFDVTEDKLYTLTPSTQSVLKRLDDRLIIEAYFSEADRLPAAFRELRLGLENLLDEYVQMSQGRIVLQYFDPASDVELAKKAERLGIKAQPIQDAGDRSLSFSEIWQGVRLIYAGDKQKVIPLLGFAQATSQYEAVLTPIIKELTIKEKPKVGLLAFATEAGGGMNLWQQRGASQPKGFTQLKELAKGRYELVDIDLNEGKLVPDEITSLILIRPKKLSDRQKYALDQFLMRGNKLVVFADTAEFEIGQTRSFTSNDVPFDAPDARLKLRDMLLHYGARVDQKLVADGLPQASAQTPFAVVRMTMLGQQPVPIPYPYWFQPLGVDWVQYADRIAQEAAQLPMVANGDSVEGLTSRYRDSFKRSVATDNALFRGIPQNAGPGLFWPCPVTLADRVPEGVRGEVWLRTSPYGVIEDVPYELNPLGNGQSIAEQNRNIQAFDEKFRRGLLSQPRRQIDLMVSLEGTFPSFFEGKQIPPRKPPEPEAPKDPLADPVQESPLAETPASQPASQPDAVESQPASAPSDVAAADEKKADPDADPAPIWKSEPTKLLVIGDSDFIRDDLVTGEYRELGPISPHGALFFANLLDWIAEDQDLLALRSKSVTDRAISFGTREVMSGETTEQFGQRIKKKASVVQWANILVPPALLILMWLIVAGVRRSQKQSFLTSTRA